MRTPFEEVRDFHEKFAVHRSDAPALPGPDTRELRIRLLREEFEEYVRAEAAHDLVGIADALADMLYIIYGTAVSYGIPMDEVFREVHASNMSKLGQDGKPIVREDGKVLKGPGFFPPRIKEILDKYRPSEAAGGGL